MATLSVERSITGSDMGAQRFRLCRYATKAIYCSCWQCMGNAVEPQTLTNKYKTVLYSQGIQSYVIPRIVIFETGQAMYAVVHGKK